MLPARRTAIADGRFLAAAFACLLALGLAAAVFVWTPGGQEFDTALLLAFLLVRPSVARSTVLVPGVVLVAGVLYCLAAALDRAPTTTRDDS